MTTLILIASHNRCPKLSSRNWIDMNIDRVHCSLGKLGGSGKESQQDPH